MSPVEGRILYGKSADADDAVRFFRRRGIECAVTTGELCVVVVTQGMDEAMMLAGKTITRALPPFEHAWRFYIVQS
jgi:hypothetical protein